MKEKSPALSSSGPAAKLSPDFCEMPTELALKMIDHYLEKNVDHSLDSIVRMIYFEASHLKTLLGPNVEEIKFIVAAYLADDPSPEKRNLPTILIQQKSGSRHQSVVYYDIQKVSAIAGGHSGFCPPPQGGCTV